MKTRLIGLLVAVLVLGMASSSLATGWGVGGFAGVSIPLAQDDAENGTVYGARAKLSLGGILGLEPNVTLTQDGDWKVDEVEGEFKGTKFTSFGINLLIGGSGPVTALRFFSFVGAKYYSQDNDLLQDTDSRLGWNGGVGVEFGAGNLGFEGRGGLDLMTLDGGGSRKWAHITGGINIYFGAP